MTAIVYLRRWAIPLAVFCLLPPHAQAVPLNVILFIGDGMGFEQVEAARYFGNGDTAPLLFESFPYMGQMTTDEITGRSMDSAASATAMATGRKSSIGVVSQAIPGDGSDLPTVLEILQAQGKRTGLVTSHAAIIDATPAAFGAHESTRFNRSQIASDLLNDSRPNVLFGRTNVSIVANAAAAGYTLVTTDAEFVALDPESHSQIAGAFSESEQPTLAEMTAKALQTLDNDPDGFFLMVETSVPRSIPGGT